MKASTFRRLLNVWPPFLFSGIFVRSTTPDFRDVTVCLRPSLFTRTGSGAHFGGSLFAMTDPFYALMLAR